MAMNSSIPEWDETQELIQDQGEGGTFEEARRWAEQYAREHPEWTGNSVFKAENGRISLRASWIERNGWVFPLGVATAVAAAPVAGALFGGGSAAAAPSLSAATGIPAGIGTSVPVASLGGGAGLGASAAGAAAGAGSLGAAGTAATTAGASGVAPAAAGAASGTGAMVRSGLKDVVDLVTWWAGNRSQQTANREAAQLERESFREAMDYQREQDAYERAKYKENTLFNRGEMADYRSRLEPYRGAGLGALARLSDHFGGSAPMQTYARPTDLDLPEVGGGASQSRPRDIAGGAGMVTIQAPNGDTRQIPRSQAQHYIDRGGVLVQ